MKSALKIFNFFVVAALSILTGYVSAMFFLGSPEVYDDLKRNLVISFFLRALAGIIFGLVGVLVLIILNFLIKKVSGSRLDINLKRLFLFAGLATSIAAIVGSFIFFKQ